MAKAEKGEDEAFVPPDFDEDAFIHTEMVAFRAGLTVFVWGILCALASWGLFAFVGGGRQAWLLGLALLALFGAALKPLYRRVAVDTSKYTRRNWLGAYSLLFLTWLALLMLVLNPPLGDYAAPQVVVLAGPAVQQVGAPVQVDVVASDNVRVVDAAFTLTDAAGRAVDGQATDLGGGHVRYHYPSLAAGTYRASARATDAKGHTSNATANLTVSRDALQVFLPRGGELALPQDAVAVKSPHPPCPVGATARRPCLTQVVLVLDSGANVTLDYSEALGSWHATANFKNWRAGANTFRVEARQADQYVGTHAYPSLPLRRADLYTLNVTAPGADGLVVAPRFPLPPQPIPGAGVALLALGLVAAAAVRRRRGE